MRQCKACDEAEEAPRLDLFRIGCVSCMGRAFAMSCVTDEAFALKAADYRAAIDRLFSVDAKDGERWVAHWRSREAIVAARQKTA
jgi:hypothetical protein